MGVYRWLESHAWSFPPKVVQSVTFSLRNNVMTSFRVVKNSFSILTHEIVSRPHLFRQHKVQGFNKEQRLQAQFHHKATDDFNSRQPGYCYNNHITLKARPISSILSLKRLADRLKMMCRVPAVWNIGTTIVMYWNGRDKWDRTEVVGTYSAVIHCFQDAMRTHNSSAMY